MDEREVVVIGGGVVGLMSAFFLRQRGSQVTVLEAGKIGDGCSGYNAGWITPSLSTPLPAPGSVSVALRSLLKPAAPVVLGSPHLVRLVPWLLRFAANTNPRTFRAGIAALAQLNRRTFELFEEVRSSGVSYRVDSQGILCAFLDRQLGEGAHRSSTALSEFGMGPPRGLLLGPEARERYPQLSERVQAAYLFPKDFAVDPRSLTSSLGERLRARGVSIIEDARVTGISRRGGDADEVHLADGSSYRFDSLLLAAGSGTAPLLKLLGKRARIEVAKGYYITARTGVDFSTSVSCGDRKVACIPTGGGGLRLGGIVEFTGDNSRISRRRVRGVLDAVREYVRDGDVELSHPEGALEDSVHIGKRTLRDSGLPILDRVPGLSNVYISSAHAMLGMTLSAASGYEMARFIDTRRKPETLIPFTF